MDLLEALRPESLPSPWQPYQPIDLLPTLRLKYPGWVRDSMLSVELVFGAGLVIEAERGRCWQLRFREFSCGSVHAQTLDLAPITQEDDDNYGFEDHTGDEYPFPILAHLLDVRRCKQLAEAMPIFNQRAMQLIEELSLAKDVDEEKVQKAAEFRSQRQLRFCEQIARGLAAHVADGLLDRCTLQVRLEIKELGLWRETAEVVQDDGHMLRQMAIDDLEMRASRSIKTLTLEERRALWLHVETSSEQDALAEVGAGSDEAWNSQFDPMVHCGDGMADSRQAIVERLLGMLNEAELETEG